MNEFSRHATTCRVEEQLHKRFLRALPPVLLAVAVHGLGVVAVRRLPARSGNSFAVDDARTGVDPTIAMFIDEAPVASTAPSGAGNLMANADARFGPTRRASHPVPKLSTRTGEGPPELPLEMRGRLPVGFVRIR